MSSSEGEEDVRTTTCKDYYANSSHVAAADEQGGDGGEPLMRRAPAKGRSCVGCLYFSSQRRDGGKHPICVGLSFPENRAHSLMGEAERDALKDSRRLLDFKYACVGYSVYKQNTSTLSKREGQAELPACLGFELLGVKKASQGASSPTVERQDPDEGPSMLPGPPSTARPPTIGGIRSDEFLTRFARSAGLIASAVGNNISRLAGSIKSGIDDIFYPDRRRPK